MRFLADESCDFAVVRALRAAQHDVVAVSETFSGAEDEAVIGLAVREKRILITEDKDFGRLVYASLRGKLIHRTRSLNSCFWAGPAMAALALSVRFDYASHEFP